MYLFHILIFKRKTRTLSSASISQMCRKYQLLITISGIRDLGVFDNNIWWMLIYLFRHVKQTNYKESSNSKTK